MVVGSDDMNSVVAGGDIARNAAENNYILGKVINQKAEEKLDKILGDAKGKSLDQLADQYVASKDPLEKAALFTILSAGYVSLPASTTELELMIATAGLSRAFAPQIGAALNRVDDGAGGLYSKIFGSSKPELRLNYEQEVKNLSNFADELRLQGKSSEEIARVVSQKRNELKIEYRKQTEPELVEIYEARNIKKYQNPLGPTADQLKQQGKSWEDIIKSSSKSGGHDLGF